MFSTNEIVGSYRIIRPLGEGGMAVVYEVEHVKLGVHYALKTFTLQEGHVELFRKRFSVEGKILARFCRFRPGAFQYSRGIGTEADAPR